MKRIEAKYELGKNEAEEIQILLDAFITEGTKAEEILDTLKDYDIHL